MAYFGAVRRVSNFTRSLLLASVVTSVGWGVGDMTNDASAQSLSETLAKAYQDNPTLLAARAEKRFVDEDVPQALSGWRPRISINGTYTNERQRQNFGTQRSTRGQTILELEVRQNIYSGGGTLSRVESAEIASKRQKLLLQDTEQQILTQAVSAYMDVVRDQAVYDLNAQNELRLRQQLEATEDRFAVGEVTQTDVAQARSRMARAVADKINSKGQLEVSRASFERVVGLYPGRLETPDILAELPSSREEAIAIALESNPNMKAAVYARHAALSGLETAKSNLLPNVDLVGTLERNRAIVGIDTRSNRASIGTEVRVPIYQQGTVTSQIRQEKQRAARALELIDDARRTAMNQSTSAWETYKSSQAEIEAIKEEVNAAEIALEGVEQEATVGQRTVLEILDAEQELLNARVSFVRAERELFVARYTLLSAIGGMTARDLGLDVNLYNPDEYYEEVRGKWWGLGDSLKESEYDTK